MYVKDFPGLYYNANNEGCKCKICEMFPPLSIAGGHSRGNLSSEAVKSLTDHPKSYLKGHTESAKTFTAAKQSESTIIMILVFQGVFSFI